MQTQQPMTFQIPLNQLEDIMCESCGQHDFVATMKMKKIPALYSPNGQAGLGPTHSGYACAYCGAMYDLTFKYLGHYDGQQSEDEEKE